MTFGLLIFGLQMFGTQEWRGLAAGMTIVGVVLGTAFVGHELKVSLPVLPVDLLRLALLSLTLGGGLVVTVAVTFLMLHLPFELNRLGFTAAAIGATIPPFAIATFVTAPAAVMLSDKIPAKVIGAAGLAVGTLGACTFIDLPDAPRTFDFAWRTGLAGMGFSAFLATNGRIMVAAVPRERVAGASSLLGTTRKFGTALGAALFGLATAFDWDAGALIMVVVSLALVGLLSAAVRLFVREARTSG